MFWLMLEHSDVFTSANIYWHIYFSEIPKFFHYVYNHCVNLKGNLSNEMNIAE